MMAGIAVSSMQPSGVRDNRHYTLNHYLLTMEIVHSKGNAIAHGQGRPLSRHHLNVKPSSGTSGYSGIPFWTVLHYPELSDIIVHSATPQYPGR
jgi:hypothetical protein